MPDPADALVLELEDLGRRLTAIDPAVDVVGRALGEIERTERRTRKWRRVTVCAAVAAVIALLVLVIPPARHAVADLFGIGGERITRTSSLPSNLGTHFDLGQSIDVGEARRDAPAPIATPTGIGAPDAAFHGRPEGGTSFVWEPSAQLPRVFDSEIGLLLTEFPGRLEQPLVEKAVPPGTTIEPVTVDGGAGYWLGDGVHEFFYLDAEGDPQPDTARLAATTLLWERDGVTYRLESALDRDAALTLARDLTPAR
jgi:hypothetical protein